jgi:hypothetical protein
MNKFTTAALSTILAAGLMIPSMSSEAEARNGRNTAFAAGAVLGIAGAAALASRPAYGYYDSGYGYRHSGYRRSGYRGYCRDLARRCDYGSRRACYHYDRDC